MYKVIRFFTDLQDHDHAYRAGDEFPRKGRTVSEQRLEELSTNLNKRGIPLIEKVKVDEPEPEPEPDKNASEGENEVKVDEPKENIEVVAEKPKKGRKTKK